MKRNGWTILASAACMMGAGYLGAVWAADPVPAPAATGPAATAKVEFFDDFAGKELDRTKWNVEVSGNVQNGEKQAYVDSTEVLYIAHGAEAEGAENGALVIQSLFKPGFKTPQGKAFDFISGRINTRDKVEATYGTISARIKLTAGTGLWPAFWLLGNGGWPATGEIDIMENVGEADWTSAALHGPNYAGEKAMVNKLFLPAKNDVTQWHVYSVDWSKDRILFYVDDTLVYRATRPMVENYGKWAYDNPKFIILNQALGGAYPVKTNGVKQPYNGLPQETVDIIKAGKAKVLVDWVKITKP